MSLDSNAERELFEAWALTQEFFTPDFVPEQDTDEYQSVYMRALFRGWLAGRSQPSEWVATSTRLPKDGERVVAFIDIEKVNPAEANHIRFVQGVINEMPLESRVVPIEPGRHVELYRQQDPRTQYIQFDGRAHIEKDDDGNPFLTLIDNFGHHIMHSDCATYWMDSESLRALLPPNTEAKS